MAKKVKEPATNHANDLMTNSAAVLANNQNAALARNLAGNFQIKKTTVLSAKRKNLVIQKVVASPVIKRDLMIKLAKQAVLTRKLFQKRHIVNNTSFDLKKEI